VNRKCFILIFYISYHPLQQDNVLDCELVYQTYVCTTRLRLGATVTVVYSHSQSLNIKLLLIYTLD